MCVRGDTYAFAISLNWISAAAFHSLMDSFSVMAEQLNMEFGCSPVWTMVDVGRAVLTIVTSAKFQHLENVRIFILKFIALHREYYALSVLCRDHEWFNFEFGEKFRNGNIPLAVSFHRKVCWGAANAIPKLRKKNCQTQWLHAALAIWWKLPGWYSSTSAPAIRSISIICFYAFATDYKFGSRVVTKFWLNFVCSQIVCWLSIARLKFIRWFSDVAWHMALPPELKWFSHYVIQIANAFEMRIPKFIHFLGILWAARRNDYCCRWDKRQRIVQPIRFKCFMLRSTICRPRA